MKRNIIAAVFLMLAAFVYFANKSEEPQPQIAVQTEVQKPIGRIGEGYFNFDIADSPAERSQGLSGWEMLKNTEAMLFVFDTPGEHCFWMKDMKFSIDILWFDTGKKLIYEKRGVSPATYPESFCSSKPAKYVVEVTAGVSADNQIKLGDKLDIEL